MTAAGLPADVLLVSLGSTSGLRTVDDQLAGAIERAGARIAVVRARPPRNVRTLALTDLVWALAARHAAQEGLRRHRPRAVVYGSVGAALLWPRPGAIRLDAAMAANRPGRHGVWQRPRERLLLRRSPLLVPQSAEALAEVPVPRPPAVVVPPPVALGPEPRAWDERDVAAVTYAADPWKKGLDRVLAAWRGTRRDGEELVVCGARPGAVAAAAGPAGIPPGVRDAGPLAPEAFADLLAHARTFVIAPRREDHGLVQLEALAAGCRLVTTTAPGAYVALAVARVAAPRLVVDRPDDTGALAAAIRSALDAPRDPGSDDAARARASLAERFDADRVDAVVRDELLPALLG
ncbi:glycosyltransferase [Patulibacter minatonensis]|uniref:glycosyltransferase n=1 Tax=Patulibacter minatonensis TaxID=298163 RepID=UPI00047E5FA6|nr:glycosyltransferase [Patulibacter minatonensis]